MDSGVKFVLENYEKTLELVQSNKTFEKLLGKVRSEYARVKTIKMTGNMYQYFLKFKGGKNRHASEFAFLSSFGIIRNEEMADYLKRHFASELSHLSGISELIIGKTYSNNEIATVFECSYMGGMRRSIKSNCLVLIAAHNNPLYDDQWTDDGVLNYTGMGKSGDQSIDFMQNKTLAESETNGVRIYLFESFKRNEYYFDGQVELAGAPYVAKEFGEDKKLRDVIKFPVKRVIPTTTVFVAEKDVDESEKIKAAEVRKFSAQDIKEKAKAAGTGNVSSFEAKTTHFQRNQFVSEHAKNRSQGYCDLCQSQAPFIDSQGNPYLESHHVITLSEGGPDTIYNTVALCPNCHRMVHNLRKKEYVRRLQTKIEEYLELDHDQESLTELGKIRK